MRHPPARRQLSLPVAGTPPLPSLNAVAATGLGTTYNTQRAFSNWEVQISTTGAPTFSVQLQGSLDGQAIINIGSPITTTGLTNVTSNTPLTMVALNLTALSGGTLTGTIAGTESPAGAGGGGGAVTQSTGAGAAAPWSVELSDGAAFYVAAKDTTLSTTNTEIGGLTETAPATDIASSGLNGRLQRMAQRITSLIALLPTALVSNRLDVNLGAAPATVTIASPTVVQGAQNAAGAASWPVQGAAAVGAAAVGSPVLIGGTDVANAGVVRTFLTDGSGRLIAIGGGTSTDGIGNTSTGIFVLPQNLAYNATGWDRVRNNVDVTLLASAARTTTQSGTITTYNLGAIKFILDMTVITAGPSVTLTISETDLASGKTILLLSGAAVVTAVTNEYTVDPMIPAVANVSAQKRVPRTLFWQITANNANSGTYSLGSMQLPA